MIKKLIFSLYATLLSLSLLPAALYSATWTPPQTISPTTVFDDVTLTYNTNTQQIFAAWGNSSSTFPTYSIYSTGSSWGGAAPISILSSTVQNVHTAYNSATGQMFAAWADSNNSVIPTSSIYTQGSGWGPVITIPSSSPASTVQQDVFLAYNKGTEQIFAAWADSSNNSYPTYAIYNSITGWSTPTPITTTSSTTCNITLIYDDASGQFLAAWRAASDSNHPYYSIFNGSSWSTPIAISTTSQVNMDIALVYDIKNQQILASWCDTNNNSYPTYAIYNSITGWSTPIPISTTSVVSEDVELTYDSGASQIFAAWSDSNNNSYPTYSIYTSGFGWSPSATITTSSQAVENIYLAYNSSTAQIFAAWQDGSSNFPTWSLYQSTFPPPTPPVAPKKFVGKITRQGNAHKHKFKLKMEWQKSTSTGVVGYEIYADNKLIATIPVSSLKYRKPLHSNYLFKKHIPKKYKHHLDQKYRIRAVNATGLKSPFIHLHVK